MAWSLESTTEFAFRQMVPATAVSMTDLDQVVALLAGITVLGFGLYSTLHSLYVQGQLNRLVDEDTALTRLCRRLERLNLLRP
jgi:hypothetical protein